LGNKPLGRQELKRKILEHRRDLTEAHIDKLIEEKLRTSKGFLTEEGAAFLIAQELGVKVMETEPARFEMNLGSLVENLKDISVMVRLISLYGCREFIRKDGKKGKILRATIADNTGIADLVVWDDRAETFKAQPNQLLRISHGYTRRGLSGRLEIHVGDRGEVQVLQKEEPLKEGSISPPLFRDIASLKAHENSINLRGEILDLSSVSTFKRPEGQGKVVEARIRDKTGVVTLILWNEKVDLYANNLRRGATIRIYDARTKAGLDGKIEVHLNGRSRIEIEESAEEAKKDSYAAIGKLPQKGIIHELLAQIVAQTPIREFSRKGGMKGKMVSFLIRDETGFARLVLWDEKAELARSLKVGDWIVIREGSVRAGIRGPEIHIDNGKGNLEPISRGMNDRYPLDAKSRVSAIKDLKDGQGYITVEGSILEPPSIRKVVTQRGREAKVASFTIKDATGTLKISLWNKLSEEASGLKKGDVVRIENFFLRRDFKNELEASNTEFSSIKLLKRS
jgi:ssDNA-binding replication factor A large subunit